MSNDSELKSCPKCGTPIPLEAPQGLCPKCLLAQASLATDIGKGASRSVPPSLESLAGAFPQLEILELIGQGGMGFVYKARQRQIDRIVALKILPESLAADPAFAERFTREGKVLARLNHPNIVTIYDFGQAHGFFYLLMEFVDGVNLRQAMRVGRFTPEQAIVVVPKICEALQFAHNEGILHRDIKPENILLDNKGRVKIADFGIAKLLGEPHGEANLTAGDAALGTLHYMAPEQLETPGTVDHRADIYSLGVVFYEMLTGELPLGKFQAPSRKVQMDVRLDEVVLQALEKEPQRRYQNVCDVKTRVETIASTASVGTPPIVLPTPSPKPAKDLFWRRFAIIVLLVFLAPVLIPVSAIIVALVIPPLSKALHREKSAVSAKSSFAADSDAGFLTVTGRVADLDTGKPISKVKVVDRAFKEIPMQETTTDADGRFILRIEKSRSHSITCSADGYETNSTLFPRESLEKARTSGSVSHNVLLAPIRFVLDSIPPQPGETNRANEIRWRFKGLIPPHQLVQALFIHWSNGVPSIDEGLSAYFKVGDEPEDADFIFSYWKYDASYPVERAAQWNVHLELGTGSTYSRQFPGEPPFRKATIPLRTAIRSGHQGSIPLIDYIPLNGMEKRGASGVELRIVVEPLKMAAIRTLPTEKEQGNSVRGSGLIRTLHETMESISKMPAEPGTPLINADLNRPVVTLLAIENHAAPGYQMWKPDGGEVSEPVRSALTNSWWHSSQGVLWYSVLVSNWDHGLFQDVWLAKVDREKVNPFSARMETAPALGGILIRFPMSGLKSGATKVRVGLAVRPPKTLLGWEGKPLKLVQNYWRDSEEIDEIYLEEFASKKIMDFDPWRGFFSKTNSGTTIHIDVPIERKGMTYWMMNVTDQKGREHPVRSYQNPSTEAGQPMRDVWWDVDLISSDIKSIQVKGNFDPEDFYWVEFEDVALRHSSGVTPGTSTP
jgi:serine/threonine protein kinase